MLSAAAGSSSESDDCSNSFDSEECLYFSQKTNMKITAMKAQTTDTTNTVKTSSSLDFGISTDHNNVLLIKSESGRPVKIKIAYIDYNSG